MSHLKGIYVANSLVAHIMLLVIYTHSGFADVAESGMHKLRCVVRFSLVVMI